MRGPTNPLQVRLSKIKRNRITFIAEINSRGKMSKKFNKNTTALDYAD